MTLWDQILDWTVYFSFDRTGFERHQKAFQNENLDGSGKTSVVTGANKGIGFAAAKMLVEAGATVYLACRSQKRGEDAAKQLGPSAKVWELDLSNIEEVKEKCRTPPFDSLDILIHNAGGMPEKLSLNPQGQEITFATHVLGPAAMTKALAPKMAEGSRVVFVSSGGMYLQKLDLSDLNWEKRDYDKYTAYANAKRAQLVLTSYFQEKYGEQVHFSAMHPGWVETEGVESAMPTFYQWMKKRLRTPKQGADTAVWLALTEQDIPGGRFWFDRKEAPLHKRKKTKESPQERQKLIQMIEE